jgi:arylformamidase
LDVCGHVHAYMRGSKERAMLLRTLAMTVLLATVACSRAAGMQSSSHAYGASSAQVLDLYRPDAKRPAPLILFVHGGGWSAGSRTMGEGGQPAHFTAQGYAWATIGYRLVPEATVEEQAGDIARAIGWLHRHARKLDLDDRHIILVGHSSGAQLAALIATDPQWLKAANVPFDHIAGVVSIDGAGVDVPGIMAAGAQDSPFYAGAFGSDVGRQIRLSPLAHIGAPDAPHWLFLFDGDHNASAGWFAEQFAQKARAAGRDANVVPIAGTTHMKMLDNLGQAADPTTEAVDAFIHMVRR